MADPAPEFVPDHQTAAQLHHGIIGAILTALWHIVESVPQAAPLRAMMARASRDLQLAADAINPGDGPPPGPPMAPPPPPPIVMPDEMADRVVRESDAPPPNPIEPPPVPRDEPVEITDGGTPVTVPEEQQDHVPGSQFEPHPMTDHDTPVPSAPK